MGALLVGFGKFLIGPVGRWLLVALAVTALVVVGVKRIEHRGWMKRDAIARKEESRRDAEEARRAAEAERVLGLERAKLEAYNRELDERLAAEKTRVAALEDKLKRLFAQLKKEVKTHVTKEDDARIAACGGVPVGFVVLHDRAARADPGEAAVPTEAEHREQRADSGVALSEVADTVVENYSKYHRCMTSLRAWEKWYDIARDTHERNIK